MKEVGLCETADAARRPTSNSGALAAVKCSIVTWVLRRLLGSTHSGRNHTKPCVLPAAESLLLCMPAREADASFASRRLSHNPRNGYAFPCITKRFAPHTPTPRCRDGSASTCCGIYSWRAQQEAAGGARVRCMLVADVAAGNALVTTDKDFPQTWTPPPGIHSVVGEVRLWAGRASCSHRCWVQGKEICWLEASFHGG